jgi:tripartite-type tricarboxylate transporter receptor subunit TctC
MAAIALATGCAAPAFSVDAAKDWPDRTVDYIIPFGDGGESTIAARLQEPAFKQLTGQSLAILNKPGGGGAVVWSQMKTLPADGYTIVGINLPHIVIQPAGGAGYKTSDIAVVSFFHYTPNALVVRRDSPFKTLDDFVAAAKKRPGELRLSGSGKGTANHLAQLRFDHLAGVETTYSAYKGTGESYEALMAGEVDAAWGYLTVPPKHQDDVRLLALATENRVASHPALPTFRELGIDMVDGAYRGIGVPKKTPAAIRKKIAEIFAKVAQDKENAAKKAEYGFVSLSIPYDELPAFMAQREKEYLDLARRAGLIK